MDMLPIILFWGLSAACVLSRGPALLYLFFGTMPFGSFAVVPTAVTAGLTFTATPIVALLIIARMLASIEGLRYLSDLIRKRPFVILLLGFWIVTVVVTLLMPRLFEGQVLVMHMRSVIKRIEPLHPSTQNISQLAYLSISIFGVFALVRLMQAQNFFQHAMKALCFGGSLVVFTGMLDFANQFIPLTFLLEPFRTASYALLTDVEVLNTKRVIGLMPEASSYGALAVAFLSAIYFLRHTVESRWIRTRAVNVLVPLLVVFCWLSTSSSTYIGLIVFFICAAIEWSMRAFDPRILTLQRQQLARELALAAILALLIVIIFAVNASTFDPVFALFDRMVLQKTHSSSFEERGMWSAVSWDALLATYGLGVGAGSTRASNAFVSVLSNTGFLGGALFYGFVIRIMLLRLSQFDETRSFILSGVRWAYVPSIATVFMTSVVPDFGCFNAWLFAAAISATLTRATGSSSLRDDALPPAYKAA